MSGPYYKALEGAGDCEATSINGAISEVAARRTASGEAYLNNAQVDDPTTTTEKRIASAGSVELINGGLELSGTDLATEISEMITTQRGYQANTRIITVTDSMLEELVNMKR
jgi:flagellar hook protein FlgE